MKLLIGIIATVILAMFVTIGGFIIEKSFTDDPFGWSLLLGLVVLYCGEYLTRKWETEDTT